MALPLSYIRSIFLAQHVARLSASSFLFYLRVSVWRRQVGAGHGKFSYLVLQHLLEMREFLPTLSPTADGGPGGSGDAGGAEAGQEQPQLLQQRRAGDEENEAAGEAKAGDHSAEGATSPSVTSAPVEGADARAGSAGTGTKATGEAAGERAWPRNRGGTDGLPFRYVVTDVAQVRGAFAVSCCTICRVNSVSYRVVCRFRRMLHAEAVLLLKSLLSPPRLHSPLSVRRMSVRCWTLRLSWHSERGRCWELFS